MRYVSLTCNVSSVPIRREVLDGVTYTVVPMIMMKEGVIRGHNSDTLFYPELELSKTPASWNHKPIIVRHAFKNGIAVSACDPVILSKIKVGIILNTRWNPKTKRLIAEAWIDENKAASVDSRVIRSIRERKVMELSTGLFSDVDPRPGFYGGVAYQGVARNYRPDHLALLPDEEGAFSVRDGAGLLRVNSKKESKMDRAQQIASLLLTNTAWTEDDIPFLDNLDETIFAKLVPKVEVPVVNNASLEQYISAAPPAVQEVLADSIATYSETRKVLANAIIANSRNTFTPEALSTMTTTQLKAIAAIAEPTPKPAFNFAGLGIPAAPVTANQKAEEPLVSTKWEF